ncbi:hypothetical protein GZ77_04090 [Endozoicomonas montiporae]|uniref:Uncharacterized protein n=1 Tax=Endozoicomonas montiporae TaxID=1027273 RepID=A0A081NBB7_9GAMM|nr:hypothetical protein GZ77_04090 [Endozoicomonas montiporae]
MTKDLSENKFLISLSLTSSHYWLMIAANREVIFRRFLSEPTNTDSIQPLSRKNYLLNRLVVFALSITILSVIALMPTTKMEPVFLMLKLKNALYHSSLSFHF